MLGIRPGGNAKQIPIEVVRSTAAGSGQMVTMTRSPGELATLTTVPTFDPGAPGTHRLASREFADYVDKTLYFRNYPYGTLSELYFSGNGVVGMKYRIGSTQKRYCGKWWIADAKVCWGVLGARQSPLCYDPYVDSRKRLVFVDDDPKAPERHELTRSEPGDSLGHGAGSRRAFDDYLQVSAREDRRLEQYARAHDVCEQRWSSAAVRSRDNTYDTCMSDQGYSMGLFGVLSPRTAIGTFEALVTGGSSLTQCTF